MPVSTNPNGTIDQTPNTNTGVSADAFAGLTQQSIAQQAFRYQPAGNIGIPEASSQNNPLQKPSDKLAELKQRVNLNVPNNQNFDELNLMEGDRFQPLGQNLGIPGSAINYNPNTESSANNNTQPTLGTANLYPQFSSQAAQVANYFPVESVQQNPIQSDYNPTLDPFNYQQQASANTVPPGFFAPGTPGFNEAVFSNSVGRVDLNTVNKSPESFATPIAPQVPQFAPTPTNIQNLTQPQVKQQNLKPQNLATPAPIAKDFPKEEKVVKPESRTVKLLRLFKNDFTRNVNKTQEIMKQIRQEKTK